MPVRRPKYAGTEVLTSTSMNELFVALRLADVAEIVGMVEGPELDDLINAAGAKVKADVWQNELPGGPPVTMITIEAVRAIMRLKGTPEALKFTTWLNRQFPANASLAALGGDLTSDYLFEVEEMYRKNPDIQASEIASRLKISEVEAEILQVQIRLFHQPKI